jgi:hypothetical protein
MTTEQFELRKARRWPWLAALAVIILLAIAFWWWIFNVLPKTTCWLWVCPRHHQKAMASRIITASAASRGTLYDNRAI